MGGERLIERKRQKETKGRWQQNQRKDSYFTPRYRHTDTARKQSRHRHIQTYTETKDYAERVRGTRCHLC